MKVRQSPEYTFKFNSNLGRHGWLRLTPAYSVKLVREIIADIPVDSFILDPFSGTATTGLVAAEYGLNAHCLDINPFLIWLGNAKCRDYSVVELARLECSIDIALRSVTQKRRSKNWIPNIHKVERWWCAETLRILAAFRQCLVDQLGEPMQDNVSSLAWIAFCRLVIETSSAAFNHVSMSFKDDVVTYGTKEVTALYLGIFQGIVSSVTTNISGNASVHLVDSRGAVSINNQKYSHVVTSPPYPNRISYIRELRPYMYWLKFLDESKEAGELDWKAIGGTWGIATSRLQRWQSEEAELPQSLHKAITGISATKEKNSNLMSNYVFKYFEDMHKHFASLRDCLEERAVLAYIVGNSSFYGNPVPTDRIMEDSLRSLGFSNVGSRTIRKRNSKKELYEYCVLATWKEDRKVDLGFFKEKQMPLLLDLPS